MSELRSGLIALAPIARLAREGEVAHAIGTPARFRHDMLHFQRHVLCAAVRASPSPLFEQIFPHLVPQQLALLILHAGNFWIHHLLRIELDQFE